jgi:hypothetical protein
VGARYCAKLIRKETCPRIATWLIFEIGVVMSLAAYFASHDHSIVKAALIGVVIDVTGSHDFVAMLYPLRAFILCVIIVVLVGRWEQKSKTNHSLIR